MSRLVIILIVSFFSSYAFSDSSQILCENKTQSSVWRTELKSGSILAGIEYDQETVTSFHDAGTPIISQWFKKMIETKSIQSGSVYFIERTLESNKTVTMMTADIVDGQLQNIETKVWFLELGQETISLNQLTCLVAE